MRTSRLVLVVLLTIGLLIGAATPVAASHDEEDDHDESTVINIDLGSVVDAIRDLADDLTDFTGDFSEITTEILFTVFFQPFLDLLRAAANMVVGLMVWLPDTTMEEVVNIHRDVFLISTLLSSAGFTWIGLVYMGYDPVGIPYERVRPLIPKLLGALVFGAVAPWALKYPVDLVEMTAAALAPTDPSTSGLLMLSGSLIIVSIVQSLVLLTLLAVLVVQKIYILFAVAAAPLIALLWALPFRYTQRQAERLIGAFWGFLLVGPLLVIVFRLTVALLSVQSFDAASWVVGLGGILLMLGLPFIVVSSGMTAAGPAIAVASGTVSTISNIEYQLKQSSVRQTSLDEYGLFGRGSGVGNQPRNDENPFRQDRHGGGSDD